MKFNNPIWRFLASVQLALFLFIALGITSIIGTVIPQDRPITFYAHSYGDFWSHIFAVLEINTMYSSWWFLALLSLLALNLIVCSIDRWPVTRSKLKMNSANFSTAKLEKQPILYRFTAAPELYTTLHSALHDQGWKASSKNISNRFFSEKNRWSYLGVYVVHLSILVIFAGALIGSIYGYKGSILIGEGTSSDIIYSQKDSQPIPLGFTVQCNSFDIEYYDTGMPKSYRSHLTIQEDGKNILDQEIEVNRPLHYQGITFYQASYEGFQNFIVTFNDHKTGKNKIFDADFQEQYQWPEAGINFGILNVVARDKFIERIKIWLQPTAGQAQTFWLKKGEEKTIIGADNKEYTITAKQMFATGLQVAKDPGVWCVYLGCLLLMIGLFICFFIPHQRVWLVSTEKHIVLAAASSKNSIGLENKIAQIASKIDPTINQE